jgi:prophage maintenance system killer protein
LAVARRLAQRPRSRLFQTQPEEFWEKSVVNYLCEQDQSIALGNRAPNLSVQELVGQIEVLVHNLWNLDANELAGIVGNIYQSFGGANLYPSIEDKASNLLYFIIKDHPFSDGNKRSASFLFIYFLDKCDYLYKSNGEKKINDNALTTLTLLVASSDPKEKDILIKLIKHLLFEQE